MDIVIPFQNSINQDNELRYTLRSIDKFLFGAGQVFIVGDKPKWEGNYTHISYPNPYNGVRWRDRNIVNKMLMATKDQRIPEQFMVAHDDNFITAPCDIDIWPYYHMGREWKGAGDYWNVENNTREAFPDKIINNFDLHCPHIMTKEGIVNAAKSVDWTKEYGYCIKTLYAVSNGIEGEFYSDLKIRGQYDLDYVSNIVTAGRRFFSCSDTAWNPGISSFLKMKFPEKSKYEI